MEGGSKFRGRLGSPYFVFSVRRRTVLSFFEKKVHLDIRPDESGIFFKMSSSSPLPSHCLVCGSHAVTGEQWVSTLELAASAPLGSCYGHGV